MKKSKLMTKDERAFQVAAIIVLAILSLCAILPFVLIFIASFTEEKTLTQYGYTFFPGSSAWMPTSIWPITLPPSAVPTSPPSA